MTEYSWKPNNGQIIPHVFLIENCWSIRKMRELAVKQKVALRNQITALLLEFNIRVSPRNGDLSGVVQATLEEAENGFSLAFREALAETWKALLDVHARGRL